MLIPKVYNELGKVKNFNKFFHGEIAIRKGPLRTLGLRKIITLHQRKLEKMFA